MQSDIDAQLTSFSGEAPPREFVTAMRGYDREQVDEHIRQIDAEVRQHREQAQAMQRELSEARRQIHERDRPAYSGLGARIEQLLRLAEEQATEVVPEGLDEGHHQGYRWPSPAAKKALAVRKIAFTRRSSAFSRSSARIRAASADAVPGRRPRSTRACLVVWFVSSLGVAIMLPGREFRP
jgi:DivIVA domain-containing protein